MTRLHFRRICPFFAMLGPAVLILLAPTLVLSQTTTWNAGNGSWTDDGMWSLGTPDGSGVFNVIVDSSPFVISTVTDAQGFINEFTILGGDTVEVGSAADGQILRVQGNIFNEGTLRLVSRATSPHNQLWVRNAISLTGAGTIDMATESEIDLNHGNGHTLDNQSNTIRGSGRILGAFNLDINSPDMNNQGLITADVPAAIFEINAHIDNTGGIISATNQGTMVLDRAMIQGGTLSNDGQSEFRLQDVFLKNITVEGQIEGIDGNDLNIEGTIENNGTIKLDSTSSSSHDLILNENTVLSGTGILEFVNLPFAQHALRSSSSFRFDLTNSSNHTISGSLLATEVDVTNEGTILANVSGQSVVLDSSFSNEASLTNSGVIRAQNGGEFRSELAPIDNTNGSIVSEDGMVSLVGQVNEFGLNVDPILEGGQLTNLQMDGGVEFEGVFKNVELNGLIEYTGPSEFQGDIVNHGTVRVKRDSTSSDIYLAFSDEVVLTGGGRIIAFDFLNFSFGTSFLNVDNSLEGLGYVQASQIVFEAGSLLAPGDNDDTVPNLDSGSISLTGSSQLNCPIELDMYVSEDDPTQFDYGNFDYDYLLTFGTLNLNGPLTIRFVDAYDPQVGDYYHIMSSTSPIEFGDNFSFNTPPGFELQQEFDLLPTSSSAGEVHVYRLRVVSTPNQTLVRPATLTVTRGQLASGNVAELADSDNQDVSVRRLDTDVQSVTEIEVKGVSPTQNPNSIEITTEASVFARSSVNQQLSLFNYDSNQFEVVSVRPASRFSDQTHVDAATGDLSRFVEDGTGCMRARLRFASLSNRQKFSANVDQLIWYVGQ